MGHKRQLEVNVPLVGLSGMETLVLVSGGSQLQCNSVERSHPSEQNNQLLVGVHGPRTMVSKAQFRRRTSALS